MVLPWFEVGYVEITTGSQTVDGVLSVVAVCFLAWVLYHLVVVIWKSPRKS